MTASLLGFFVLNWEGWFHESKDFGINGKIPKTRFLARPATIPRAGCGVGRKQFPAIILCSTPIEKPIFKPIPELGN